MNMGSFDSFHSESEVKDMESQVLWAHGKTPNKKKALKFHHEPNFNNFQEIKNIIFLN